MGETLSQRIDFAFELAGARPVRGADQLPRSRPGTPLGDVRRITRARRSRRSPCSGSCCRRVAAPRRRTRAVLGELQAMGLLAGANALIVGNYLTTTGRPPEEDLALLDALGMPVADGPGEGRFIVDGDGAHAASRPRLRAKRSRERHDSPSALVEREQHRAVGAGCRGASPTRRRGAAATRRGRQAERPEHRGLDRRHVAHRDDRPVGERVEHSRAYSPTRFPTEARLSPPGGAKSASLRHFHTTPPASSPNAQTVVLAVVDLDQPRSSTCDRAAGARADRDLSGLHARAATDSSRCSPAPAANRAPPLPRPARGRRSFSGGSSRPSRTPSRLASVWPWRTKTS